jgi:outer membrane beta-barrel protein
MRLHIVCAHVRKYTSVISALALLLSSEFGHAQSKQYQRKKTASPAPVAAPAGTPAATAAGQPAAAPSGDKLDISELEQKYWAPKDTDFSVVQNRTYTKSKRFAASALLGIPMNDNYNDGFAYGFLANYYLDERYGFEFQYIKHDYSNSQATKEFYKLSGGAAPPDFNRPVDFIGLGFNWVPFYAKMSVLGSKIIYFDMQFTPVIGMSTYEQQARTGAKEETAFTYGFDLTQYFFVHKNFAYRFNYQNRWSSQEVLAWDTGLKERSDRDNTSTFLFGFTYFH